MLRRGHLSIMEHSIIPRFHDTDMLGHINHASIVTWLEEARRPIFRVFAPDLDSRSWSLIIARLVVNYRKQITYNHDVIVKTSITRPGRSSMTLAHEVWQQEILAADAEVVLVHFDYQSQKSKIIPDAIWEKLALLNLSRPE